MGGKKIKNYVSMHGLWVEVCHHPKAGKAAYCLKSYCFIGLIVER